jgi:hypothetical protein
MIYSAQPLITSRYKNDTMGSIPPHVNRLNGVLKETEFDFLQSGKHHIQDDIYPAVKREYPDLCDDSITCDQTCNSGNVDQPEWKHRVRTALGKLREDESSRVSKGKRYYWQFD